MEDCGTAVGSYKYVVFLEKSNKNVNSRKSCQALTLAKTRTAREGDERCGLSLAKLCWWPNRLKKAQKEKNKKIDIQICIFVFLKTTTSLFAMGVA